MASEVRIYAVSNGDTGETHFVEATNQPQAMRHVARSKFSISVASSVAVADHMTRVEVYAANDLGILFGYPAVVAEQVGVLA